MVAKRSKIRPVFLYCDAQPPLFRYGCAVLAVALAIIATLYIPAIGQRAVFLFFFFATIQSAFWFGLYPGILAMFLSLIAVNALIMLPTWGSNPQEALILNAGYSILAAVFIATINLHRNLTAALLEKQQDLDHAQMIGHTGNWRLDVRRNKLRLSDENHRIFGIPKGTPLTYETFLATVHPEDRDYVDCRWQAALHGEPYDIEHRIIVAGKVKWVRERAELEHDSKGNLLGGFGTTQDITDLKLIQQELLENRRRYAGIVESSLDAMITVDADRQILLFNPAAEKMFGCNAEEALGRNFECFIPERFRHAHGTHADSFGDTGVINRKMGKLGAVMGLRTNGEEFPIEASISQCEINGKKLFTTIMRDITEQIQAKQALQKSEERLALGVQVAGLALAEVDYTTGLSHLTAQAAQLLGLGETEMVLPRAAVHAAFHPDDRAELLRRIDECLNPDGGGWFDMHHRILLPDGAVRWLHVRKRVTFSGEGKASRPLRATLAIHDITTEKQSEEVVIASDTFVRSVLNSLPEHVVVLDADGTVSAVNGPWERFSSENNGAPHPVSLGENYLDVCRRSSTAGDPYANQELVGLEDLFAGRRQDFVMEYPCHTPSLTRWFLLHAKRVREGFEGVILSRVDITERKQTEEELHNALARLGLIIDEVKAGYWDWDLKTNKLFLSPEWNKQLGLDKDDSLINWNRNNDRLHPDDRAFVKEATDNFIAGREPNLELEFRLRHKDGSYRWIHSRGALLCDQNNEPLRLLGLNLDITDYVRDKELKENREAIEKSFRLYVASQTAAAIAHELNQPLTAISYYAYAAKELVKSNNPNPQKLANVMEKCGKQAQRAGDVIKQLLAFLHKGETVVEPLDINKSVNFALDIVNSNSHQYNFTIELDLADGLPLVTANALQIQKVLINLMTNALEAMNESGSSTGTVTVTTCRSPAEPFMVQVSVRDSGIGAPDIDALNKMFQPFYTTKSTGLGMGLAISRALVEAHGGKMWAENNVEAGITVYLTLPFVP